VDDREDSYYASADGFNSEVIQFDLRAPKTFDCLMIQEAIQLGQRITSWSVEYSDNESTWHPVPNAASKQSIGHKWIVRFDPITATRVRLILSGRAPAAISTFGLYKQP
jgi:alpha-L-fucosidase